MIYGFAGRKRSGKDTAAQILIEAGLKKIALADGVRSSVEILDPYFISNDGSKTRRWSEIGHTWESVKDSEWSEEARRLLQVLGTDLGRGFYSENFWVDRFLDRVGQTDVDVVCTDVRFQNEVDAITSAGGVVILVTRPGLEEVDLHESEKLDIIPTHTVLNDGTVGDLHNKVRSLVRSIPHG